MKKTPYIVEVTFPNKDSVESTINKLLTERLIACANYFPVESKFIWQNKFCNEQEYLVLMKTENTKIKKVEKIIIKMHPYDTPVISSYKIDKGNKRFLEWLMKEVR